MGTRTKKLHSNADNFLNLESTRTTTSTSLLELASLGSDIWLDSIVGVFVVDGGSVSEVSKSSTALWSTEKDGVSSGWCAKCELIESETLSSSSNMKNALNLIRQRCFDLGEPVTTCKTI